MQSPAASAPLVTTASSALRLTVGDREIIRDIYLPDRDDGIHGAFCYLGNRKRIFIEGHPIAEWVEELLRHIRIEHPTITDFQVTQSPTDIFRGHRINSRRGPMITLRRMPQRTPLLQELALPTCWGELFLNQKLNEGGLILMAAETGQGKSTTIASILATRLSMYGGFALTVEDPIELPLDGAHGDGECLQTEIDPHKPAHVGYAEALRGAFRSFPSISNGGSILLIGEARDPDIAAEAIRAAAGGQLVITTVHANELPTALARLTAMAARQMGDETARDMLASSLRLVIHQTLTLNESAVGWKRGVIGGELVWSGANSSSTANMIRSGNYAGLNQTISLQQAYMRKTVKPSLADMMTNLT